MTRLSVKPTNIRIEKLLSLPYYTEGPAADAEGNLYVTTLTGGNILKIDPDGNSTNWGGSKCPNGQIVMPDGEHLVCDSQLSAVRRFSKTGTWIKDEVVAECAGRVVNSPNDLVADKAGGFYFTDSIRQNGNVYYVSNYGKQFLVAEDFDYPNGLVLSADETQLFVAESYRNSITVISLKEPGVPEGVPKTFVELPVNPSGSAIGNLPDGVALDTKGRLWVAHYGMGAVQVISPKGTWLFSVDTGLPLTSNVFLLPAEQDGGDSQTLIVTGGYGEPGPGAVLKIIVQIETVIL